MHYGALYEIEPQLNKKGYTLGENKELLEDLHRGLVKNYIHGTLTDGMFGDAVERLNALVGKYAVPLKGDEKDEA